MNTISINGRSISVSGNSVSVINGKIIVDGQIVEEGWKFKIERQY